MAELPKREPFEELIELLRKHDLDWLASDTIADIALGRTQKRVLAKLPRGDNDYQEVVVVPGDFRESRRRTEFLTSEPFSHRERLERLIEAVQNTIVESANMEASILRTTELSVTFVAVGEEPQPEPDVDPTIVRTRGHEAEELRKALTAVLNDQGGEG